MKAVTVCSSDSADLGDRHLASQIDKGDVSCQMPEQHQDKLNAFPQQ